MKKLKKFVLNDARVLSREELASIEGALDIHAEDHCYPEYDGKACVYYFGNDGTHTTLILGVCRVYYAQDNEKIVAYAYCV